MICIAENDIGAQFPDLFGIHGLDGGLGADRHEGGGPDRPMRCLQRAGAGLAVGVGQGQGQPGV